MKRFYGNKWLCLHLTFVCVCDAENGSGTHSLHVRLHHHWLNVKVDVHVDIDASAVIPSNDTCKQSIKSDMSDNTCGVQIEIILIILRNLKLICAPSLNGLRLHDAGCLILGSSSTRYMDHKAHSAAMNAVKWTACVAPKVSLMNLVDAGDKTSKHAPWIWNPG